MAYDGERTILFGGYAAAGHRSDSWEWNGTGWTALAGVNPSARDASSVAYDPARDRLVLFGGSSAAGEPFQNDTWEMAPQPGTPVATHLTLTGTSAVVGGTATMLASLTTESGQPVGGRTIKFTLGNVNAGAPVTNARGVAMFAGLEGSPFVPGTEPIEAVFAGDLLFASSQGRAELSITADPSQTWSQALVAGPSARYNHAMAGAPGRVVLFGGWNPTQGGILGDTWEWNGSVWTLRGVSGPTPRFGHAMAYDSARDRVVLVGGVGHHSTAGTWEWDGTRWTLQDTTFFRREGTRLAYDSKRRVTVLFGGLDATGLNDETWEWDGISWTLRHQTGITTSGPSARRDHAMAYDAVRGRVVLFGGHGYSTHRDTWEWDGIRWLQTATAGPPPHYSSAMAYDVARSRVVLFGGGSPAGGPSRNTWEWDGTRWIITDLSQLGPTPRYGSALAYDVVGQRLVLFGGSEHEGPVSDTWERRSTSHTVSLQIAPTMVTYGSLARLSATLTIDGVAASNVEIIFSIKGDGIGSAITDANGVGTLLGVSIAGLNSGTYIGAVRATWAHDTRGVITATGNLTMLKAMPQLTLNSASTAYDAMPHGVTATIDGVHGEILSPVILTYDGRPGEPVEPGTYAVIASYGGSANYQPATATALLTVRPPNAGADGLVAAYSFNENAGTVAADASGRHNTGIITGAQHVSDGRFGSALSFDGVDDWVTVSHSTSLNLTAGLTMEAWVRPTRLSGWNTVALKERTNGLAYALYASDNEQRFATYVRVGGADRAVAAADPLPLHIWTHVAVTYNGSSVRLYVNGIETRRRALTGSLASSTGVLRLGGNSVWSEFFQGSLDEVRIYNRALTPTEIHRDMTVAITRESVPPVVTIVLPVDRAELSGTPTVAVTATDNVAISSVRLEVDGVEIGPGAPSDPYAFTLDLANGSYVLRAVALDTAGNVGRSDPVRVTITNVMIAAYDFQELDGATVLDSSGHGNAGVLSGGVTRATDAGRGHVLSFDGTSGLVTVPDASSLAPASGLTLEAWVKPTSLDGWRAVVLKESATGLAYALYASDNAPWPAGYVRIQETDEPIRGTVAMQRGVWMHLAVTYDGSWLRMFIDGVEIARRQQKGTVVMSDGPLRIGGNHIWGEWFSGEIDDVRIYGVAIGSSQIKADMARGSCADVGPSVGLCQ
jgi:hypothetical protein